MAGITAYGAYVPRYRLGAETDGWDSPGQRSIANFDEDSVSMAVAAGIDCLKGRDRDAIDGLLFASTTPPYAEKQCASIIAMALDLRRDIFTADITDVLRAGTTAQELPKGRQSGIPETAPWLSSSRMKRSSRSRRAHTPSPRT